MIEKQIKSTKTEIEDAAQLEQQLRVRETELSMSLRADQAKLNEWEQQLSRLERSLAALAVGK